MPYVTYPRVRKGLCRLATMTALGVFASTGVAAACATQPTTQPFTQFGDTNSYFVAPGGNFEPGQAAWQLNGATIARGSEFYDVSGNASDSQSLALKSGTDAISPAFCVDSTMPGFRFFARQSRPGPGTAVTVQALYTDAAGNAAQSTVAVLPDGSGSNWTPTASLGLATLLNVPFGQSWQVQLRFSVTNGPGQWQIDDVYVDPYRSA